MLSRSLRKKPVRSVSAASAASARASAPVSNSSCQVRAIGPRRIGTPALPRASPLQYPGLRVAGGVGPLLFVGRVGLRLVPDRVVAGGIGRDAVLIVARVAVHG